ncbi:MAG: outer membrane beta-barrel protein [bacterium]
MSPPVPAGSPPATPVPPPAASAPAPAGSQNASSSIAPHRLEFEAGPSWLSTGSGGPTYSGYSLQGRLGQSFRLSNSWNMALNGVFSHSRFTEGNDSVSRTSFGVEVGPEVTLARNIFGLGLYGGFHQAFYYTDGIAWGGTPARVTLDNSHVSSFSIRPSLMFFGGILTASFQYDHDFGLLVPGATRFDAPIGSSPDRFTLGFSLDLLRLFYAARGGFTGNAQSIGEYLAGTQVSATAQGSYSYSFNQPAEVGGAPGANAFRANDPLHNRVRLNVLRLGLDHPSTAESPFGYNFTFTFGQDPGAFAPRDSINVPVAGQRGNPSTQYFAVQQAYLSYRVPLLEGLTFTLGQFATPVGAEVADGPSNTFFLFSRGLNTTQGQPYYHAGGCARLVTNEVKDGDTVTNRLEFVACGVNGWDSTLGHEPGGTAILGVNWTPVAPLALSLNYLIGDAPGGPRGLADFVATWTINDNWSLGANIDFAHGHDPMTRQQGYWGGASLYQQWAPASWIRATTREEIFRDAQGLRTGTPQTLASLTGAVTFLIPYGFGVGPEIRYDASFGRDAGAPEPFAAGTGTSDHNITLGVQAFWHWPDLNPPRPASSPAASVATAAAR